MRIVLTRVEQTTVTIPDGRNGSGVREEKKTREIILKDDIIINNVVFGTSIIGLNCPGIIFFRPCIPNEY